MTTEEKAALVKYAQGWIKDAEAARDEIPFGFDDETEKELSLIKIALAALTAEPVAHLYQWAACITCEGPQRFSEQIEREAPPEWAIEEGQAKGYQPLYSTPPLPTLPESWRLVPVEPTVEMINAAQSSTAWDKVDFWDGFYDDKAAYQAMLAAAPTP